MDQNTGRQLDGVQVDKMFTDKASGKDTHRPELSACMDYLREGDELLVHSMDRLSRSLVDLRRTVDELVGHGVRVTFVKEALTFTADKTDPCAVLLMSMIGAVAEFERSMILDVNGRASPSRRRRVDTRAAKRRCHRPRLLNFGNGWLPGSR